MLLIFLQYNLDIFQIYPTDNGVTPQQTDGAIQSWANQQEDGKPTENLDPDSEKAVQILAKDIHLNTVNEAAQSDFDIIFVGEIPVALSCKKCEQVLKVPKILPCGHEFCAGCLVGIDKCPECGQKFDASKVC